LLEISKMFLAESVLLVQKLNGLCGHRRWDHGT